MFYYIKGTLDYGILHENGLKTTKHDGELLDTYFDYILDQSCSKTQTTIVLSSIEVGYKAMIKGMEKGIWLKMLLAQIGKTIGKTHHNLF
jgi:hypothetical protein